MPQRIQDKVLGPCSCYLVDIMHWGNLLVLCAKFSTKNDVDDERKFTAGCTVCAGEGTMTGSYQAYIMILPLVLDILKAPYCLRQLINKRHVVSRVHQITVPIRQVCNREV